MGEKSGLKILAAIENSKKQPWHKQLYGLGILHIGEANAKAISEIFPSAAVLALSLNEKPERLTDIFGIGKQVIDSLTEWFEDQNNKVLINHLRSVGVSLEDKEPIKSTKKDKLSTHLNNKTLVITGTLPSLSRKEVTKIIENAGGKINSSISSKTNYLLAGDQPGSKLRKAKEKGIEIINERELIKLTAAINE